MEPDKKVSAEVFVEIETLKLLRQSYTLQFRAPNGGISSVQTKILDVFEDEEGQYLLGEGGLTLQLNQLLSINGKPLEHLC